MNTSKKGRVIKALLVVQLLLGAWLLLWLIVLVHHIWVVGGFFSWSENAVINHVFMPLGPLALNLYLPLILMCVITLAKWLLRRQLAAEGQV